MADIARLVIEVDSKGVPKANARVMRLTSASQKNVKATDKLKNTWMSFSRLLLVGSVAMGFRFLLKSIEQGQKSLAQLEAGLKSTGGMSGQTMESMVALGEQMQRTTVFADDLVQSVEAILLSFTNITDDVFPRTIQAAADVATRMGIDLRSAVVQLAKALNDPIQNLGALSRSGIQFSKQQKKLIKSLWETGQQAEAQRIILGELDVQYGGSARAARDTLGGAIDDLGNSFSDLAESIGGAVSPVLIALISDLSKATTEAAKFVSLITGGAEFQKTTDALFDLGEAGEGVATMQWRLAYAQFQQKMAADKAAAALALQAVEEEKLKQRMEQRGKAIDSIIVPLEMQAVMMRKTTAAQAAYNVFLAGGTIEATNYARRLTKLIEAYAQQESIKKWIVELKTERDVLEMSAGAKAFYTAMTNGATRAQAREIVKIVEGMEARRKEIATEREAISVIQSLRTEKETLTNQIDIITKALNKGTITTKEWADAFNILLDRMNKLEETGVDAGAGITKSMITLGSEMERITLSFGTSFIDTLFDAEARSKLTFESVASGFAKMVARMLAQQALLSALGMESIFGAGWRAAKGGVVSAGRVTPMARGGVVTQPTLFPMARGAGLMGEAGPEAVMPLTRTSSGELGVKAEGAGAEVHVNIINNTGARVTQQRRQSGQRTELSIIVGDAMEQHIKDGRLDRAMDSSFDLKRVGGR